MNNKQELLEQMRTCMRNIEKYQMRKKFVTSSKRTWFNHTIKSLREKLTNLKFKYDNIDIQDNK